MKTLEIKGIKVHIDDEDLAKALEKSVAEKSEAERGPVNPSNDVVSDQEAEILLKELEEWLTAGRSHVLNQARKELRKQYVVGGVVGGGEAAPPIPFGSRIGAPSPTASSVSGVVTVPRPPAWLTGVPQVQAATQEIAITSLIEAVTSHLSRVLEEFAAKLAEWVASVAEGLFQTISDVAGKLAEAHEKLGGKLDELGERLSELVEKFPAAAEGGPVAEERPPEEPLKAEPFDEKELLEELGEGEAAPVGEEEVAPQGPSEGAPPAEVVQPPRRSAVVGAFEGVEGGVEGVEGLKEEAAAALFSPQFLAAFARHLSQMTKEVLATREAKRVESAPRQVKAQTPFDIAQEFASSILRKATKIQQAGEVQQDLTSPVVAAKGPTSEGAPKEAGDVAKQVSGAAKDTEVYKHLRAASKSRKEEEK